MKLAPPDFLVFFDVDPPLLVPSACQLPTAAATGLDAECPKQSPLMVTRAWPASHMQLLQVPASAPPLPQATLAASLCFSPRLPALNTPSSSPVPSTGWPQGAQLLRYATYPLGPSHPLRQLMCLTTLPLALLTLPHNLSPVQGW